MGASKEELLINKVKGSAAALLDINEDYITGYPQEYQSIAMEAIKHHQSAICWINKGYIANHPEKYHLLALEAVNRYHQALNYVNKDYTAKYPEKYRLIAIEAVKHHEPVIHKIDERYATDHPEDYRLIAMEAVKHHDEALSYIKDSYINNHPEKYRLITIEALKHNSSTISHVVVDACWNLQRKELLDALTNITQKSKKLSGEAAQKAMELYINIGVHFIQYCKRKITPAQFKANCDIAIEQARPVLEQHRGWKEVLFNLALAIAGLGIGYIAAGLINLVITSGKHFFFRLNTDTVERVTHLKQSIDSAVF